MLPAHVTCNKNKSIRSNVHIPSPCRSAFKRLKMRVNLVFSVKWVHTRCTKKEREREKVPQTAKQASEKEGEKAKLKKCQNRFWNFVKISRIDYLRRGRRRRKNSPSSSSSSSLSLICSSTSDTLLMLSSSSRIDWFGELTSLRSLGAPRLSMSPRSFPPFDKLSIGLCALDEVPRGDWLLISLSLQPLLLPAPRSSPLSSRNLQLTIVTQLLLQWNSASWSVIISFQCDIATAVDDCDY